MSFLWKCFATATHATTNPVVHTASRCHLHQLTSSKWLMISGCWISSYFRLEGTSTVNDFLWNCKEFAVLPIIPLKESAKLVASTFRVTGCEKAFLVQEKPCFEDQYIDCIRHKTLWYVDRMGNWEIFPHLQLRPVRYKSVSHPVYGMITPFITI